MSKRTQMWFSQVFRLRGGNSNYYICEMPSPCLVPMHCTGVYATSKWRGSRVGFKWRAFQPSQKRKKIETLSPFHLKTNSFPYSLYCQTPSVSSKVHLALYHLSTVNSPVFVAMVTAFLCYEG